MPFRALHLSPQLLQAVRDSGYTEPTPIQIAAIPLILAGHDITGIAQTGTGKTAAFVLPILMELAESRQTVARRDEQDRKARRVGGRTCFWRSMDFSLKAVARVTSLISPYAPASAPIMYPPYGLPTFPMLVPGFLGALALLGASRRKVGSRPTLHGGVILHRGLTS
jgi:hypothetical protein